MFDTKDYKSMIADTKQYERFVDIMKGVVKEASEKREEITTEARGEINKGNLVVVSRVETRNLVPWWNKKCQQAVEKRKVTFKAYRRNSSNAKFIEYKSRAEARNILRTKRKRRLCTFY